MNKTLPFIIIGVLLLIEHSQGKSISTEGTENLLTSNQYNDSREAFRNAVITKFSTLSAETLKLGIKLFQDTSDENLDNGRVTVYLTQAPSEYRNIKSENSTRKMMLFLRLSYEFDFFSRPINDEAKDRNFLLFVKGALEKHDLKAVVVEFQNSYDEFLKWLTPEIDEYSHKVNSEEQLSLIEFKKFCIQFKEATNIDDKIYAAEQLCKNQLII